MKPIDTSRFAGRVMLCSNHFKVQLPNAALIGLCYDFTRRFIRIDGVLKSGEKIDSLTPMTVFAAANKDRTEFRFHKHAWPDFQKQLHLCHLTINDLEVIDDTPSPGTDVNLLMHDKWVPRGYQHEIIDFGLKKDFSIKLLGTQTGGGKSFMASYIASKMGKRVLMAVKAGYINKWVSDFAGFYNIPDKSIMVAQGGSGLKALTMLAEDNQLGDTRIILVSSVTLMNWIKLYEADGIEGCQAAGYMWGPDELWSKAGIGLRLIDEVHQEFHAWFRLDLYTNVSQCISMSATLLNKDPKTKQMYQLAYPQNQRKEDVVFKNYIDVNAVNYCMGSATRYRTTVYGKSEYSHVTFEQSLMKQPKGAMANYTKIIKARLQEDYVDIRKENQRAIVFCATTEMCTFVRDDLRLHWPDMVIERYCGTLKDPIEHLKTPDVIVSTVLSSGTAHDIPGLICTVQTIAVDSLQSNKQTIGRLRYIADQKLTFNYFTCVDIPKHVKYAGFKHEYFHEIAKSFNSVWIQGYL